MPVGLALSWKKNCATRSVRHCFKNIKK